MVDGGMRSTREDDGSVFHICRIQSAVVDFAEAVEHSVIEKIEVVTAVEEAADDLGAEGFAYAVTEAVALPGMKSAQASLLER